MRCARVLLLLVLVTVRPATAQATALPTFFAPRRAFGSSEVGVTLSQPGGDATGIEGRLGASLNRADLAFRGGYLDPGGQADGRVVVGVEARIPLIDRTPSFPFDGAFILGLGRHFADGGGQTFVPLGLSLGRRLALDGPALQLTPYVQPTVIFADDGLVTCGLGVDLLIRGVPEIRFSTGVGDIEGFSLSLYWAR